MKPQITRFVIALMILSLVSCATTAIPGASQNLLEFLRIGSTERQETVLKLGQPSASFEQETILTYRVGHQPEQGYYVISPKAMLPWQNVRYSLVLVFDNNGILQKKSLVGLVGWRCRFGRSNENQKFLPTNRWGSRDAPPDSHGLPHCRRWRFGWRVGGIHSIIAGASG